MQSTPSPNPGSLARQPRQGRTQAPDPDLFDLG